MSGTPNASSSLSALLPAGARVLDGPERVGSEQRWHVELGDGQTAQLGVLLPELARDESIRRRYVRDVERLHELSANNNIDGLAPILEHGPQPDPRDVSAPPPWRLRADPRGQSFAQWLERRAPAPIDEAVELVARIAEVVHRVHAAGAVLRDLDPRGIVLTDDRVWLTDVGLARVDILSTRTAASLVLEGSPYASPEQIRHTTLDQRSDLFALGVMLYQALTGSLPFGDGPSFLRDASKLLPAKQLRPQLPAQLDAIVGACLAEDPRARPESAASLVRALRGEGLESTSRSLARVACQSCGAPLRLGQRLCLSCGKQAVLFKHTAGSGPDDKRIVLRKVSEDAELLARLRRFLESVSASSVPSLDFVHGDQRMYSKTELARRIKLPVTLFDHVDEPTAAALQARMRTEGFEVKLANSRRSALGPRQRGALAVGAAAVIGLAIAVMVSAPLGVALAITSVATIAWVTAFAITRKRSRQKPVPPMLTLRAAPAALSASDPLVARLAALLRPATPEDVREQVGELALLVQRLVDHRAALFDARELELVSQPVEPLVGLIEAEVRSLAQLDAELTTLDEGRIVRALAASDARGEARSARESLLVGLDRLRALEDQRAAAFHRLLEASSLLRRSVELGLDVVDPEAEHARNVELAMFALGGAEASEG